MRKTVNPSKWVLTAIMTICAVMWIAPVLWMLSTSLKIEADVTNVPLEWIPVRLTFENYYYIFFKSALMRWFLNSVIVACFVVFFDLFFSSLAAFSLSRIKFPGRNLIFSAILATLMIPQQVTLVPLYLMVNKMNLIGTYPAMVIPRVALALGVFMLRQFFLQIPKEYEEAADIEGAGRFMIYLKIMLPMTIPALSALAIFSFLGAWNDFMWPLIVTGTPKMFTLPVGLANFSGTYQFEYARRMAAALVGGLPVIIVFLFFQKQFIQGITMTGLKG